MKQWYSVQAKAGIPEVSIHDEIGACGVTAKAFIDDLKRLDAPVVKLSINSPGGSVFDALAMYNALRQHPADIHVSVIGVAASAASLVAMAGDRIEMPENAFMMIHNPLNFAYGNADDLREMADVLDKIAASLVATYAARTGLPDEEIKAMLADETWLSAAEAVEKGFADELQPALRIAASFDMERLPENVRAAIAPEPDPAPPQLPDARALAARIVALASDAGLSAHAEVFVADPAIASEDDAVAAIGEAAEIEAVCRAGGIAEYSPRLIAARVPLAVVRARMQEARAALDEAVPINHHIPNQAPGLKPVNVWDKVLSRQTKE